MMRTIDPDAAQYAIAVSYPNANAEPGYAIAWIAAQLQLKDHGLAHDVATIAIYEEHAKPSPVE